MRCLTFVAVVALIATASAQFGDLGDISMIDINDDDIVFKPVYEDLPMMTGGWGDWQEADEEIQAILTELRDQVEERVNFDLENAVAVQYMQQVVAGFNYRIKVDVEGTQQFEMFVFRNLQGDLELVNVDVHSGCDHVSCSARELGCVTDKLKVDENGCQVCECSEPIEYMIDYAAERDMVLCMVGDRGITVSNGELFSNTAATGFCKQGSQCGLYTYTMTENVNGEEIQVQHGMCVDPDNVEYYNCDALREETQMFGEVSFCNFSVCEGTNCNKLSIQSDAQCDYTIEEGEFPLMPACSMKTFADKMHQCVEKLYSGYPYENNDQCRSNSQAAMECMAETFMECSNSPCLSFLDWFPGFREQLSQLRSVVYLMQISSASETFDLAADFFNMTQADREYWSAEIAELECPTPGVVPQCIQDGMDWIRMSDFEDQVENMIMGLMMEWGLIDEDTNMRQFLKMAPCRKGYHATMMKAFVHYLNDFYSSTNRDAVCQSFTTYKFRNNFAWDSMCDNMKVYTSLMSYFGEEEADFVNYMVQFLTQWGEIFEEYQLPNCTYNFEMSELSRLEYIQRMSRENNQTICWVGKRGMTVAGRMIYENTVAPALCEQGSRCANFHYQMIDNVYGELLQIEIGKCAPHSDNHDEDECATLREQASKFGQVVDCNYTVCEGNECNHFNLSLNEQHDGHCNTLQDENDLDLMPNCSMKTFHHKVTGCMQELYAGYPYQSRDQCRNRFNDALQCFGRVVLECTNSSCLSAMDWVPGFRQSLSMVRSVAYMMEINGPEAAFDMVADFFGAQDEEKMMIKSWIDSFECPVAGELPDMFQEAYDWVQNNDIEEMASQWFGVDPDFFNMGPCNKGYHAREARMMMDFMHNFYKATERQEVCQAFTAYQVNTESLWNNMCDNNMVYSSLVSWLGQENMPMVMDMIKFLTNYGELFQGFELPNCPKQMHSEFHCERFYNNPSPCAMRKAWLCDYAQWKETFLSDWLSEFTRLNGYDVFTMMGTQQPMCENHDMGNMCKNSRMQKCFVMPVTGCLSCYCADHEYKDFRRITSVWRKDYQVWQKVMHVYRQTLGSGMGGSMTSSCGDDDSSEGSGNVWDQGESSGMMGGYMNEYMDDNKHNADHQDMSHQMNQMANIFQNMMQRRRR